MGRCFTSVASCKNYVAPSANRWCPPPSAQDPASPSSPLEPCCRMQPAASRSSPCPAARCGPSVLKYSVWPSGQPQRHTSIPILQRNRPGLPMAQIRCGRESIKPRIKRQQLGLKRGRSLGSGRFRAPSRSDEAGAVVRRVVICIRNLPAPVAAPRPRSWKRPPRTIRRPWRGKGHYRDALPDLVLLCGCLSRRASVCRTALERRGFVAGPLTPP